MATANTQAATAASGGSASAASGGGVSRSDFLSGFNRLDILRQLGLLLGLAASIALGFSVVLWSQKEDYQPLYGNMRGYDMAELAEVLDDRNIRYRIDPGSGMVLVPARHVSDIRLQVASAGVSRDNGYGYEFLDQDQGLGTSQFMENNRYRRSQEGELQRTISGLRNVQSARVHLATPERSAFIRNARKPSASVFLTLQSGRQLSDVQVQAIASLVASSVPDMSPGDVTIVDQQGNLLTRRGESRELAMAAEQFEYVRRYEETLVDRVSRILQLIVGPGRYTAEVSADIDFTRIEQAAEQYNPDATVLRSEQSMQENNNGPVAMGIPGALSNQPPGNSQLGEGNPSDNVNSGNSVEVNGRHQATRNFEIDRTISYTNFDPIAVRRISVAVVIDEQAAVLNGSDNWSQQELEQMQALIRDAVGYSASRGDSVTVVGKRFATMDPGEPIEMPFWQEPWVVSALKQFAAGLFLIVLVFGVLLPVLRRLSSVPGRRALAGGGTDSEFADLDMDSMSDESVTLSGGDEVLLPGPDDSYERQLGAVRGLVSQDPGRVAQVVKHWITNDG